MKGEFSLLKVEHSSVPAVRQYSSLFLGLWLQTNHYSTGSMVSPAFGLRLNFIIGFPGLFSSLQMDNYESPWPPKLHEPILIIQTSSYNIHNKKYILWTQTNSRYSSTFHQLLSYCLFLHINLSVSCYIMLDLGNCKLHFFFSKWVPIILLTMANTVDTRMLEKINLFYHWLPILSSYCLRMALKPGRKIALIEVLFDIPLQFPSSSSL